MRRVFIIGIVTLYVAIISDANPRQRILKSPSLANPKSDDSGEFVAALARNFSSNFFQSVAEDSLDPQIISPLNTFIPASMLAYAARESTRKDYLSAIGLLEEKTQMAKTGYQRFLKKLNQYDVTIKTKLFVQSNFELDSYYSKLSTNVFKSEIGKIEDSEGFTDVGLIEEWVTNKTSREIVKSFRPQEFGCDTSIVLVNTAYLEGTWKVPFNRSLTARRDFVALGSQTLKVPTMYARGSFRHGRIDELGASFIELPNESKSEDKAISMFIIMADSNKEDAWNNMISKLRKMDLKKLLNSTEKEMDVYLPKFNLANEGSPGEPFLAEFESVSPYKETNISGIWKSPKSAILSASETVATIRADENGVVAAQSSLIAYTTRACGDCDYYAQTLKDCRKTASAMEDKKCPLHRTMIPPSTRGTRSAVPEFKVDRRFIGLIATKGKIFTDLFFIHFSGGQYI